MPDQTDMNKMLFLNLVMMLSSSAMQQLGKLVNPVTQKTEVNLEGAQVSIEMLVMLKEKTKGNLDDEETKMLNDILTSLQMNYVETAGQQETDDGGQTTDDGGQTTDDGEQKAKDNAADPSDPSDTSDTSDRSDEKGDDDNPEPRDPKFRKSYG